LGLVSGEYLKGSGRGGTGDVEDRDGKIINDAIVDGGDQVELDKIAAVFLCVDSTKQDLTTGGLIAVGVKTVCPRGNVSLLHKGNW
jgi:hypothetical protein